MGFLDFMDEVFSQSFKLRVPEDDFAVMAFLRPY